MIRIPLTLALLLAVLAVVQILAAATSGSGVPETPPVNAATLEESQPPDFSGLLERSLFEPAGAGGTQPVLQSSDIELVALYSRNTVRYAVFRAAGSPERLIRRQGETIGAGELYAIGKDRVAIDTPEGRIILQIGGAAGADDPSATSESDMNDQDLVEAVENIVGETQ